MITDLFLLVLVARSWQRRITKLRNFEMSNPRAGSVQSPADAKAS